MLSLNPAALIPGENSLTIPLPIATIADADYTPHDLTVTVTALPSHGLVFKEDGITQVGLGQMVTAAELAALKFRPAAAQTGFATGPTSKLRPEGWFVLSVPQNGEPRQIGIQASGVSIESYVTIIELPSNGTVLLADGITAVTPGQALSVAQLNGLMFTPAADASGKISVLQYCAGAPDTVVISGVLLVVGPHGPPPRTPTVIPATGNNIVAPFAVALLLDATLSSTAAALPADRSDDASPSDTPPQNGGHASLTAVPFSDQALAPPSPISAQVQAPNTDPTSSGGGNAPATDTPLPHRIGSSTPPLAAAPASSTLLQGGATSTVLDMASAVSTSPTMVKADALPTVGAGLLSPAATSLSVSASLAAPQVTSRSAVPQVTDPQAAPQNLASAATTFATNSLTANAASTNPIVLENQKPGTPDSVWSIDPGQDSNLIQGFTTEISTNVGGTVNFKIDNLTANPNYHIDIYRLGYYGGDGARLEGTIQHQAASSVHQPAPLTDPSTGLVDAGNWSVTDSWTLPSGAISGVYIANVIDGSEIFQIPFIVRDDSSTSDIAFQTDDETWQAYNAWGGSNVYGGEGPGYRGAAYAVSYNRPITTRDGSSGAGGGEAGTANDMVFSAEFPAIYWLEENGYDVSYISGIDAATNGALLLNHKVYMDVGHDEYWTDSQRVNVQAAGDAGVNLVFLSGNEVYWQTRLAPSIDSSGDANRTLITYKDTHANALIDPTGTATGTFMDARFASTGGMSGIPSNSLTGTVFQADDPAYGTITIPYGMTQLRLWRNTQIASTAPGQTASLTPNLLGYEWDSSPDNGFRPGGLVDLSSTTLQINTDLLDYGNTVGKGTATHNLVEFRDPVSGALVFGAGTVFWSWGLSSDHDQVDAGPQTPTDPNVQQAMVNLFADMGVQPATLQASLVIASSSTDHTAPTSTITQLSATNVIEGQSVTVGGTASDVGGVIGGVEVSSDGGNTWHPATGAVGTANVTWSYTFNAGPSGTVNIKTRAVDDSLNLETPGTGVPLVIGASSNLTIFNPTDTPAVVTNTDPNPVELGVKFASQESGLITGIRFYKGPQNTGTHIGDLWTSSGTLLATATFSNETASGWQQVNFATPVRIQAGVTYIASYHTNAGEYSSTDFYFDNAGHSNGALTATGSGFNGVFTYGAGPVFPATTSIANATNYWVDVVFDGSTESLGPPVANNDSGFVVAGNGTISIAASALLSNDSDPNGLPLQFMGVSNPANGAVSYNANTQIVTFTPTAGYSGNASFAYTISDTNGGSATGTVGLFVNSTSAESLFSLNSAPGNVTVNDPNSVELGVKFTPDADGNITGIRFYKGAANTGPHVADLWSSTGTLLATATFSSETVSGWQQVNLSNPVSVTAGTAYVVSYHTNGSYSADPSYFSTSVVSGDLTAPGAGNGVFAYGAAGTFPTNTFGATNYWVDVVYTRTGAGPLPPPVANNDSGFVVGGNGSLTIAASTLLANDTDPNGLPLSITGVSNPTNGTVSFSAGTQTVTFVPTAGYTGPASFGYAISDGQAPAASATVSVTVTQSTPVANNDSGFVVNENGSITIAASTLLANDTDPNGLPLSITGVSTPNNGTVAYDASAQTITFMPTSGYNGTASFVYAIDDTNGGTASASVGLLVNATSAESLFNPNSTPTIVTLNDPNSVELGVKFTADANGVITGIRFYKSAANTGPHVADLWSSTGTLLATATFSNETASGWQQVNLSNPVSITAGTTYVASYHTNGNYSADSNYFADSHVSGDLTAPAGNNGVFAYGPTSAFPTNSFAASNYWVDVVYTKSSAPVVANNDSGFVVNENGSITIAASALLANDTDPNGLPLSITSVSNPTNGTASYDPVAQSVTFTPIVGYTGMAGFTYSVADSSGATASGSTSLIVNDPSAASLFSLSSAPAIAAVNDPSAVEVGVKFQANTDGQITGLRFYKGPENTGPHIADLWSSAGQLLATATFTNESASGWQQVSFANPVAITADTTYIASYHTNGDYAADPNFFATAQTNGPLTAPASPSSGGNGVYAYGSSSLFPTNSFNSTSYGVDVLFKAQLAA
jgi:hypothetical protein